MKNLDKELFSKVQEVLKELGINKIYSFELKENIFYANQSFLNEANNYVYTPIIILSNNEAKLQFKVRPFSEDEFKYEDVAKFKKQDNNWNIISKNYKKPFEFLLFDEDMICPEIEYMDNLLNGKI